MKRAGVSTDRRRIRLAAGCSRACNASKVIRLFSSMTNSPSTTNRSNGASRSAATTSGKQRPKDVPDFPLSSTEPFCLKARQRKPSHFGSNCHSLPARSEAPPPISPPSAQPRAARQTRSGNLSPVFRGFIREPSLSARNACRSTNVDNVGSKADIWGCQR